MMAALAATAAMTACQQENLEPEVQEQEGVTVRVVASLSEETKASLSDSDYLKWTENDVVLARGYKTSDELIALGDGKVLSIDEESNTAVYEFTGVPAGAKLWLGHNANDPSAKKFEFAGFHNAFSQTNAGQINKENLMLVSEMVSIPADSETTVEVNTKMNIVGSILRFLVYSSAGVDEKLQSVKLEVADQNISGNNSGCLAYYFNPDGTYKYWYDNNESALTDVPAIFYGKDFKFTQVMLDNPYSLNGVIEPTAGSGVYMPVAPLSGTGYKYIVTTDMATYTFNAPESLYSFKENQLKNVLLNLDKATRVGVDDAHKGYVWYEGNPRNCNVPAEAGYLNSCGYTVARYSDVNGENWVTSTETKGEHEYLYSATYTYTDENGNEIPAEDSWLKVGFSEENICHWSLTYEANPNPTPRTIYVKGVMNNPLGYTNVVSSTDLTPKTYEYNFSVTQAGAGALKNVTFAGSLAGEKTFDGVAIENADLGYWLAYVDGTDDRDWNGILYPYVRFNCISVDDFNQGNFTTEDNVDWLTACFQNDGTKITDCVVWASLTENTTGAERTAYIILLWPDVEGYTYPQGSMRTVKITQKANIQVSADLNKTYTGTVSASGGDITLGTLALNINAEAVADVAAAMEQYGVTVTANNGATVEVAADGTITMDVPANPYKNGGKEYTVTVKHDGNTLATVTVNQEEGTEEGEEELTCPYTYDIENVGGWNRGFGFTPNKQDTGNWGFIKNVKLDGVSVTLTEEIANEVMSFAFRSTAPTQEEIEQYNMTSKTPSADAIKFYVRWFGGVQIDASIISGESGQITKVTGYNSDGSIAGYYMIWTD